MSTHNLDVSGARALSLTVNDPASTRASTPAKAGDDVSVTVSGSGELRLLVPETARLQRRSYPQRKLVYENGKPKKDEAGVSVYEDAEPLEQVVLVLPGGVTGFFRCSFELLPEDERPSYEGHPHTNVVVKRWKEPHYLESGELMDEFSIADAVPWKD